MFALGEEVMSEKRTLLRGETSGAPSRGFVGVLFLALAALVLGPFVPGSAQTALAQKRVPPKRPLPGKDKPPTPSKDNPPPESPLTQENYEKIKPGMSGEEVKAILGLWQSGGGAGKEWQGSWYDRKAPAGKIVVHFYDGKVVSKSSTIEWTKVKAAKGEDKITRAKFESLKPGMSEDEVQAVLGPPTSTEKASAGRSALVWRDKNKFAFVVFRDGKAQDMDCSEVPPRSKDISRAMYERVVNGMDLKAVEALLGPVQESMEQGEGMRHIWRQGNADLHIVLGKDGKVIAKYSNYGNAPLVTFESTADDKFNDALAGLRARDLKKQRAAMQFFRSAPFDEARAPEVSRVLERCLDSTDLGMRSAAAEVIKKWATRENAPYFLKIVNRKVDPRNAADPGRDKLPLAVEVLAKIKEPEAVAPLCRMLARFFDRDMAVQALKQMGPEVAEEEVRKYARSQNPDVQRLAQEILADFKAQRSRPPASDRRPEAERKPKSP
jgi:hypothetical protein